MKSEYLDKLEKHERFPIAHHIDDIMNMHAKYYWTDIQTNDLQCQRIFMDRIYLTYKDPNSNVLLLSFSAYSLIYSFMASDLMLCLSEMQSPNALGVAVNI